MKKIKNYIIYGVIILLIGVSAAGYFFNGSLGVFSGKMSPEERMKKSQTIPSPNPVVGIAQGTDRSKVIREAINNAGGLQDIIKKGDTVLIKPNLIKLAAPGRGVITDYRVVQEVVNIAKECGAERVIIGEGSPNGPLLEVPMTKYDQVQGAELLNFNMVKEEDCYKLKPENGYTDETFIIPKIYMDADVVIGVPVLKTHAEAVVTLSLKNIFGVPPIKYYFLGSGKEKLHSLGLANSIVDLNMIRKPDFVVVDGIVAGEGDGPLRPTPVNANIIIAGVDPVAVDTVGLTFMGFTVDEVIHVKMAADKNLGIADINKIKVVGADLNAIKMKFKKSTKY